MKSTPPASLYLCYQSVTEPLTQTQVVAYLEGLAQAGYRMVLLTFEARPLSMAASAQWRQRLQAKGIAWHWCRYHQRPTVPATAWDILVGVMVSLQLVRKYRIGLVHARIHVPGLMALLLKWLMGTKMLFDLRGFMAEEYVDAGIWPVGGWLFRLTKRMERWLVRSADGIVVLTRQAKTMLQEWYPEAANKPIRVIPCCVDLRRRPIHTMGRRRTSTLVYAGKLGGWYLLEPMVDFVAAAAQVVPNLRWQVWTQSDASRLKELLVARGLAQRVEIGEANPEEMPVRLAQAEAALSFIKPCVSKQGSSPTKIGEYLAAGLPVVSSAGIGDLDDLLTGRNGCHSQPVGILLQEFSATAFRDALSQLVELLNDPAVSQRCHDVARKNFDLQQVGWPAYEGLYRVLLT